MPIEAGKGSRTPLATGPKTVDSDGGFWSGSTIPQTNHTGFSLKTKDGHRAGIEGQAFAVLGRELEPGRCKHAQEVSVTEDDRVTIGGDDTVDDALRAPPHILYRLTTGNSVVEHRPRWTGAANLDGGASFVVAVVPLHQVVGALGLRKNPAELASAHRPQHRAGQSQCKRMTSEHRREQCRAALAFGGEWKVGA